MDDDEYTEEQRMTVFCTADQETWLPKIILTIPVTEHEAEQEQVCMEFTPNECLRIGAMLVQMGDSIAQITTTLEDKSLEERREILLLESQLFAADE
jgi:hypothetical protein